MVAAMEPILAAVVGQPPLRNGELLIMQARSLEAMVGLVSAHPETAPPVIQKVRPLPQLAAPPPPG